MANWWKDKDRRKGILGTMIIHIVLLLLFFFIGLTYYEPKPEDGIVINFGNSPTGMGNEADGARETVNQPQQQQQTPQETQEPIEQNENPVQTQDVVEAPSVKSQKTETKPVEKPKPQEPEKPKPSDVLKNLLENVSSSKTGGEGEKEGPGDQGDPDGDPNSKSRTGDGSSGGGGNGNYMLGNRQALNKPRPDYPCEDEGRVVVKIYVDQSGKVTRAIPGEKVPSGPASTTASSCLYDKARDAAMRTTWQADPDAPATQMGYIIYNFQKR